MPRRKSENIKKTESMVSVKDVRGEGGHEGWGARMRLCYCETKSVGQLGRDDGMDRVVGLVHFGEEEDGVCVWNANNDVSRDGKWTRSENRDVGIGEHSLLVVGRRVGGQRAIEGGILKLVESFNFIVVRTPHYHGSIHFSRFNDDIFLAWEASKGREFSRGDVEISGTPGKLKPGRNRLAGARKMIDCFKLTRSRRPVGWSEAQVSEAVFFVRCRWGVAEMGT